MEQREAIRGDVAQLVRQWKVADAGDAVHGIAFAPSRVIMASEGHLLRFVPDSGRFVDQLGTSPARGGIAFDGQYLWQQGARSFQQLDPRTGLCVRSFASELDDITGLACFDGDLLVLHEGGARLARVRFIDHADAIETVIVADAETRARLRGLAWAKGELWSSSPDALVRIDPVTARVLQSLALPVGPTVCDLGADDEGRLWCVDGETNNVRIFASPPFVGDRASVTSGPGSRRVVDITSKNASEGPASVLAESPATAAGGTFARMLVPVDFSAASKRAVATALIMREHMGGEVHLFHLVANAGNDEFLAGIGAGNMPPQRLLDDACRHVLEYAADFFPRHAAGVVVHADIGVDVAAAIERVAKQIAATLVILTDRPRQSLFRTSVEKIARDLHMAVLVLRTEHEV